MRQPPKVYLQVMNCECYGCQRKLKKTIREFQKHIEVNYGLRRSTFDQPSGTVEIVGDVDENKLKELKKVFLQITKKGPPNDDTTFCCCFRTSKKKTCTCSHVAQHNDHPEHLSIYNNNANNAIGNKSEKDGGKNQTEANHNQQQKQEQHGDADRKVKGIMIREDDKGNQQRKEIRVGDKSEVNRNVDNKNEKDGADRKGKGKMGEGSKQKGKEIRLGGTSSGNMKQRGESTGEMGQRPRELTRNESNNQIGQVGQYSRGENGVYDQRAQYYPRGYTETTDYGQTYNTNMHPLSQRDQVNGGYYRRPPPYVSMFSDEPTADGGCSIM